MGPKHNRGHTLDRILYYDIVSRDVCQESVVSHHKCLLFNTYVQNTVIIQSCPLPLFLTRQLLSSVTRLPPFESSANINDAAAIFSSACNNILDPLATFKTRKLKTTPQPQLTNEIRSSCGTEQKWRASKQTVDLQMLRDQIKTFNQAVKMSRDKYLNDPINKQILNPRPLFNVVGRMFS